MQGSLFESACFSTTHLLVALAASLYKLKRAIVIFIFFLLQVKTLAAVFQPASLSSFVVI
jgi:hypothetical protein